MGKKQQPHTVQAQAPVVYSVNFVPADEYERVVEENIQLRQRVAELEGTQAQLLFDLVNKDRELLQIKADNEKLQQRINHLEQEIGQQKLEIGQQKLKIERLEKELNTTQIYQKFSDSSRDLFNHMYDTFCGDNSEIRKQSQDTDLYHLYDHLIEFTTKKYLRWSRVVKDLPRWNSIYNDIINLLQKEYDINDIKIFLEIIKLRMQRNSFSHQTSPITLEELRLISPYADQIWDCLS